MPKKGKQMREKLTEKFKIVTLTFQKTYNFKIKKKCRQKEKLQIKRDREREKNKQNSLKIKDTTKNEKKIREN